MTTSLGSWLLLPFFIACGAAPLAPTSTPAEPVKPPALSEIVSQSEEAFLAKVASAPEPATVCAEFEAQL